MPDTDSDADVYGQKYVPSTESLGPPRMGISESSTPTFVDSNGMPAVREPYPAWSSERQIPLSKEEIEDIFLDLTQKFGFQRDSMRNMVRYLSHAPTRCFPALPPALPNFPSALRMLRIPFERTPCVLHASGEARRPSPGTTRPPARGMWSRSWHLFSRSCSRTADASGLILALVVLHCASLRRSSSSFALIPHERNHCEGTRPHSSRGQPSFKRN